jgi:hypothetical protein
MIHAKPSPYFLWAQSDQIKGYNFYDRESGKKMDKWEVWIIIKRDPEAKEMSKNNNHPDFYKVENKAYKRYMKALSDE